tara:strand:- start:2954 stop:3838 length:885 start_codon:yes stop_codon:yes gene_type:complete
MAIVPIVNDVSILTIREVINLKSIILGQIQSRFSGSGQYGVDSQNGSIKVKLKNFRSGYTPGITITVYKGAVTHATVTFTLAFNSTRVETFNGLPQGTYSVKIEETTTPNRSQEVNIVFGNYQSIYILNQYPLTKISIAQDSGDITSNWDRAEGVNIPAALSPTNTANVGLKEWRGAQVFQGTYFTQDSSQGRYGADNTNGKITLYLNKAGFSNGTVTVNVDGGQSVTRNLQTSTSNKYTFNSLVAGSRQIKITDNLTGSYQFLRTTVGLEQPANRRTRTYAFNGLDVLTGYTV